MKLSKAWIAAIVLAMVVILGWLVYNPTPTPTPTPNQRAESRPKAVECPHYGNPGDTVEHLDSTMSIASRTKAVPEYNDCQRFIRVAGDKWSYDSIQAIYVRSDLAAAYAHPRPSDNPVAITSTVSSLPPTGVHPKKGQALLVIGETYAGGKYEPLGIGIGYNCIVLAWTPKAANPDYASWMVTVATEKDCTRDPQTFTTSNTAVKGITPLFVHALRTEHDRNGVPDPVPPVSRWDWDDSTHTQYIGILCPTGWCEITGDAKYASSPIYANASGADLSDSDKRMMRQKGWYDEQYLADTGKTSVSAALSLSPEHARGTVFPVSGLGARDMTVYSDAKWHDMAWISLNVASSGYESKFNFSADTPPLKAKPRVTVAMCFQGMGGPPCSGDLPKGCSVDPTNGNGTWYGRITGRTPQPKYFCVAYRSTPNVDIPGVVRWRWTTKDETVWAPCPSGCCEMNAIMD